MLERCLCCLGPMLNLFRRDLVEKGSKLLCSMVRFCRKLEDSSILYSLGSHIARACCSKECTLSCSYLWGKIGQDWSVSTRSGNSWFGKEIRGLAATSS